MIWSDWHGCYEGSWASYDLPREAVAHPAKFAAGLAERIVRVGIERGYWRPGSDAGPPSIVGDPFGGVGCGGLVAAYAGLQWIGVELEPRFHAAALKTFARHRGKLAALGVPQPIIVQGDSRQFRELVGEAVTAVLTSPPYGDQVVHGGGHGIDWTKARDPGAGRKPSPARDGLGDGYGETAGQIGRLNVGDVDAAITSPPFADSLLQGETRDPVKIEAREARHVARHPELKGKRPQPEHYGTEPGQIGGLPAGQLDAAIPEAREGHPEPVQGIDAALTSPPYDSIMRGTHKPGPAVREGARAGRTDADVSYGTSANQIGNTMAETYWTAMRQVYEECYRALRPNGVLVVVLKDYVRNKQRVELCNDTARLLEALGFELMERTRCWLTKQEAHPGLFGESVVKTKSRKGFFKRLAEKNLPADDPRRIDFEELLWLRKV